MRRSSSARLLGAVSVLLLLGAAPSLAQSGATSQVSGLKLSGDQPIQIESDKLEVRQADSVAVFSGNVTVTQGPTTLKAGKMTVYYVKDPNAAKGAAAGASAMTGSANIDHLVVDNKVYMSVASAVIELDTKDSPVFVFRNAGNEHLNIVYRRPDGNIGWIDPSTTKVAQG